MPQVLRCLENCYCGRYFPRECRPFLRHRPEACKIPCPMKRTLLPAAALMLAAVLGAGCNPREFAREHGGITRLSIATGNTGGVFYPYGGGLAKVIGESIPRVEATAEVTAASVDNLKLLQLGKVDIAFRAGRHARRGRSGTRTVRKNRRRRRPDARRPLPELHARRHHRGQGHRPAGGSRGKVVSTGSPGSGTEVIAFRVLRAAGVDPDRDVSRQALTVNASVDALKDDKIDAFFWSGGLPTASVLDLASTAGITAKLIPNDDVLRHFNRSMGPRCTSDSSSGKVPIPGRTLTSGWSVWTTPSSSTREWTRAWRTT